MKKLIILVLAMLAVLPAAIAAAGPIDLISKGDIISLSGNGVDQTSGGGPFLVTETLGITPQAVPFLTFCVEFNEYFSYGNPYVVADVSDKAVLGGVGGAQGSPVNGDPLDPKTAFLYTQFRNEDVYVSGWHGMSLAHIYRGLQAAIWYIEEEKDVQYLHNNFGDEFYAAAVGAGWTGIGGVRVMNLVDSNNGKHQDQLTIVPEPASMLLLGTGLLGLAGVVRRRTRK